MVLCSVLRVLGFLMRGYVVTTIELSAMELLVHRYSGNTDN
ncbi:MAG: hypothetical protein N3D85_02690 [Candidatus Bathyarchaeota archaeon]|nr:hypothetical protein [Candidatus Bathyarchaeota archaeon]